MNKHIKSYILALVVGILCFGSSAFAGWNPKVAQIKSRLKGAPDDTLYVHDLATSVGKTIEFKITFVDGGDGEFTTWHARCMGTDDEMFGKDVPVETGDNGSKTTWNTDVTNLRSDGSMGDLPVEGDYAISADMFYETEGLREYAGLQANCNVKLVIFDLDTELNQRSDDDVPFDYDDEEAEMSPGAYVVLNNDSDNHIQGNNYPLSTVMEDFRFPRRLTREVIGTNENDLKLFKIKISEEILKNVGRVAIERSPHIAVWRGDSIGVLKEAVLWHSSFQGDAETYSESVDGNGIKTWNLPADADELRTIMEAGLFVEGINPCLHLGGHLKLKYYPDGNDEPSISEEIKITVVTLRMDYWVSQQAAGNDNAIHNPAVVAVSDSRNLKQSAEFKISNFSAYYNTTLVAGPFTEDSSEIYWVNENEAATATSFSLPDSIGTSVKVVANSPNDLNHVGVYLLGYNEPFFRYTFKTARMIEQRYRINIIDFPGQSTEMLNPESSPPNQNHMYVQPQHIQAIIDEANRVFLQAGIKLVPDEDISIGAFPAEVTGHTCERVASYDGVWKIAGLQPMYYDINDVENPGSIEKVCSFNSREGVVVINLVKNIRARNEYWGGMAAMTFANQDRNVVSENHMQFAEHSFLYDVWRGTPQNYGGVMIESDLGFPGQLTPGDLHKKARTFVHEVGHTFGLEHRLKDGYSEMGINDDSLPEAWWSGLIPHYTHQLASWSNINDPFELGIRDGTRLNQRGENIMSYESSLRLDIDLPQAIVIRAAAVDSIP